MLLLNIFPRNPKQLVCITEALAYDVSEPARAYESD